MKILVLLVFLLSVQISMAVAENGESVRDRASISKIHPILDAWQTSDNPAEFAKNNNLPIKENKIQVYIHMTSPEFLSQIPPEIEVVAFDQKIAVGYVTSEQLDLFEKIEFVEKVMPPELARVPPIPIIETINEPVENSSDYSPAAIFAIIIGAIAIAFLIIKRFKKKTLPPDSN